MIPKIIHYCWFGGKTLPPIAQKCINSWRKYLPDYEIIEWNESNFDIGMMPYVQDAYDAKKYAFVSDVARFWILYNVGGIYLDTDVELLKSPQPLIDQGQFMGDEIEGQINPGLIMAACSNNYAIETLLRNYSNISFISDDGSINTKTICQYTTELFRKFGYASGDPKKQILGFTIYPVEYFCPQNPVSHKISLTNNTYSIHHYAGTWLTLWQKCKKQIRKILSQLKI